MLFALRTTLWSKTLDRLRRRCRRINNAHMGWRETSQQRFDQGIMSATQNENVSRLESIGKGLAQVNAGNLFRDRVLIQPSSTRGTSSGQAFSLASTPRFWSALI